VLERIGREKKAVVSRRVRRVRREDLKIRARKPFGFSIQNCFAFPVSSACSSEAGERKRPLSLAESAGCAEKTQKEKRIT
jgi:hypothetical protein